MGMQEEEERQREVSQMRASLEQMRAANEERQQKQHMAEARLTVLKVPFLPSALQSMLLLSWLVCNRAVRCIHPLKAMHGRRAFVVLLPTLLQRTSFKWMTGNHHAQHCLMPYCLLRRPPTMQWVTTHAGPVQCSVAWAASGLRGSCRDA